MTKTFNIGDRVIIDKKYNDRIWYTTKSFSIVNFEKSGTSIAKIDCSLPNAADIINIRYLVLLKEERKNKLDKLNENQKFHKYIC